MCDLRKRDYLKFDILKAVSMLNGDASKLCRECRQVLHEEGIISKCIFDTQECHLCNNKYCKVHLSDHINRRVCEQ
jgi:hypothetical protein